MKCVICKQGETKPGKVTVTLQRDNTTVIIKAVPGEICENGGEYYLSEEITGQVMNLAEAVTRKGVEVEILNLAA